MHKTWLGTLALIVLAAVPAAAAATTLPSRSPSPLALASSIATRFWGAVPCHGQVKIATRQSAPPTLVRHDVDAWVTFRSSAGRNDLAAASVSYAGCTVHLGRHRWPTRSSMAQDWDLLCMTMVHEVGHLLGHPHNTAPGNVMNPAFTDYSSEPQLCRTDRPAGSGPPA